MTYSHLTPEAESKLALSDEDRIYYLMSDKWIGYDKANEVLNELKALLNHPKIYRMPNLLLVGRTNSGKTQILRRFWDINPAKDNEGGGEVSMPVMYLQAPPSADEKRLYAEILNKLFAKYFPSDSILQFEASVKDKLKRVGLRVLIIDELHNVVVATPRSQQKFLTVLKYLCNELQISIVVGGTEDARRMIQTDPQLTNRFNPVAVPRWKLDKNYQRFLASYEPLIPLRRPSGLSKQGMAQEIYNRTDGTIGEAVLLLKAAGEHAILCGHECIDIDMLDQCGFHSPSDHRKAELET